ncbi:phage tail fiber protein [Serratia fonticola]|uniref:phage tail fiber domain-containing protein n=1 Tax=Serratia fonticola TaxID=47917 RepID=UPI003BB615EA
MAIPNQTPYNIFTANGISTVFPYEFYLLNAFDLTVSINGTEQSTGFTITGIGNVDGGDVIFLTPPANGSVIMLERTIPAFRLTEYQDNGDLLADTVNKDFDRLWMAIKQAFIYLGLALTRPLLGGPFNALGYRIENLGNPINAQDAATKNYVDITASSLYGRTLRVPESSVSILPNIAGRRNRVLTFNNNGDPNPVPATDGSAEQVFIELAKPGGAGLVGTETGRTVQQELDGRRLSGAPAIAFVFDDGLRSAYEVVAPLFEANNLQCGFAIFSTGINTQQPNGTVYLRGTQLLDLSRRGHEIICHAATGTPFNDDMSVAVSQAEIATCMSYLSDMGIYPKIFQSPSSVLTERHIPTIRGYFEYAFTVAPLATPMKNVDALRLWRFGIDTASFDELKNAIDAAVAAQGTVIFYGHDVVAGSDKYNNIQSVINYCVANNIPIVSPSEACSIAAKSRNAPTKAIKFRETLFNSTRGWTTNNGTISVATSGTRDITVTTAAAGGVRIAQSTPVFATDNFTVTFSTLFRSLDSANAPGEIGIIFKDSGGADIISEVISIGNLTNLNQRHYASGQMPSNAVTVEMYVYAVVPTAGNRLLLRAPTLVKGTSLSPDMNIGALNVQAFSVSQIPSQSIAANSSYNTVALTSAVDNGLYSISGNAVRPSRPCRLSISAYIFSNDSGVSGTNGGILQLLVGSLVVLSTPITTASGIIGGNVSSVIDLTGNSSIQFRVLINGASLVVNTALSSIAIQELQRWS